MLTNICSFYAITPIHAGSGASTSAVDLPIQRERHTNWPHIQASSVKGAMRSHYRARKGSKDNLINIIFGFDQQDDNGENSSKGNSPIRGAISVSDAKLLAFPMRSNKAPFVWVTCPSVLERLKKDLQYFGRSNNFKITVPADDEGYSINSKLDGQIILEDALVNVKSDDSIEIQFIKDHFPELTRLLCVSDQMYGYCVESCTEVQTNIKIDSEKGTAKSGALRYEELLPSDSVLYSLILFSDAYDPEDSSMAAKAKAETLRNEIKQTIDSFMQIGGDETLGKGICKVNWIGG